MKTIKDELSKLKDKILLDNSFCEGVTNDKTLSIVKAEFKMITFREAKNTYHYYAIAEYYFSDGSVDVFKKEFYDSVKPTISRGDILERKISLKDFFGTKGDLILNPKVLGYRFNNKDSYVNSELNKFILSHIPKKLRYIDEKNYRDGGIYDNYYKRLDNMYLSEYPEYIDMSTISDEDLSIMCDIYKLEMESIYGTSSPTEFANKYIINTTRYENKKIGLEKDWDIASSERKLKDELIDAYIKSSLK